jgi:replicative DNA helicase
MSQQNRLIYDAIAGLIGEGAPVDIMTVAAKLEATGMLKRCGGSSNLASITYEPVSQDPAYSAKQIRRQSINRKLIERAQKIIEIAKSGTDDALDAAQQLIAGLEYSDDGRAVGIADTLNDAIERYEARKTSGGITGEKYGMDDLDYYTSGMQPGDLIIIAGRPSMGKSAFAHQVALNTGVPSVVYSLEMSKEQVTDRLISSRGGVNSQRLRTGQLSDKDWQRIVTVADKLSDSKIYIDDSPNINPAEISRRTRHLKRDKGVRVCCVDYLQLLTPTENKPRHDLEIADITRRLKLMARELEMPVVLLSQLNRGLEQRENKRPRLSDLRDSGAVEQDADVVLMLYRDEVYHEGSQDAGIIEVNICKQRMGPTLTVKMAWDAETTSVRPLAKVGGHYL